MKNKARCLRCGYIATGIVPIDPEKIEEEEVAGEPKTERREINPDNVRISRGGNRGFGFGGLFGGLEDLLSDFFGVFDDSPDGYEYDPKYYDSFGNEIYVPDEFERHSIEIKEETVELLEEEPQADNEDNTPRKKHRFGHKRRDK